MNHAFINLLCILLIAFLARGYFLSLSEELGDGSASFSFNLPLPIVLLFVLSLLAALGLTMLILLRSFAKIRRKEAENADGEEEEPF